MRSPVLLFLLTAVFATAAESVVDFSKDSDVAALAQTRLFALEIVALHGRPQGEVAFARILKRDDKIRPLLEVYNRGKPEAKVYALAAFHSLAPSLFEHYRKELVGKYNPMVRSMNCCLPANGTLLEFLIRIHHREYDSYIRKQTEG